MMDFSKISRALQSSNLSGNDSEMPDITNLPPSILEALIPGYSIISRYAFAYLGIDISIIVTMGLLSFALFKGGQYVYSALQSTFESTFTSSVYIDEQDDLFDMVMAWLAAHQQYSSRNRKMRAKTQRGSAADDAYNAATDDALDENGMFNFARWSARTPPRYEPYYGKQFVWHGGRIFWFKRSRRNEGTRMQVSLVSHMPEDDILQLDCIGRSIEPAKDLLRTIRLWSLTRSNGMTTVRHPATKERMRFGGAWTKTTSRPSRPMDTVILDADQKDMIVRDMNEFLHPASPEWYARRGIPYRRGYLFHGPPGTGKTSLSFALAGIFGLEIYAMSLQEPTLTDSEVMSLFGVLPRRCIVLLEDIDAAGLLREDSGDGKSDGKRSDPDQKKHPGHGEKAVNGIPDGPKKDDNFTLRDLARELKSVQGPRQRGRGDNQNTPLGLSLSGLLNAIDGVATHEGRVLIMTTNHPEKLDAALVRPGRVDRKIEFKLATRGQLEELFVRMYAAGRFDNYATVSGLERQGGHTGGNKKSGATEIKLSEEAGQLSVSELSKLAKEFAAKVPNDTFTPAEVQNLLMRYKKDPKAAVAQIDTWVCDTLEEKEKARKPREEADDRGTESAP